MFGFINIYKEKGMTSHDVVACLRRITGIRRIGHAGTLDPAAQGVLPVAIGNAARLIEYLTDEKAYIAKLHLGATSTTCDIEGEIVEKNPRIVTKEEFLDVLSNFRGEIEQIPPLYSAVHYKGKRLYEIARSGEIPEDIPSRIVRVDKIELRAFDGRDAEIEIECSKGTYIRSIIRDIGEKLNTGAYMSELLRTQSGLFFSENAVMLQNLKTKEDVEKNLSDIYKVLPYRKYSLSYEEIQRVSNGLAMNNILDYSEGETVLADADGRLAAVLRKSGTQLKVVKMFPNEDVEICRK